MKEIVISTSLLMLLSSTILFAGAVAGVEQEVLERERVTLDGSESFTERDGKIVRYNWKQIIENDETPIVNLINKRVIKPTFISPQVEEATFLKFRLTTKEKFKNRRGKTRRFRSRDFVEVIVFPKELTTPIPTEPVIDREVEEVFLDTKTSFRYDNKVPIFFKFSIDETRIVKIITTDTSTDNPGLILRKGDSKTGEIIGIDPSDQDAITTKIIEITLEAGTFTIEVFNNGGRDGTLELLSL